MKKRNKRTSIKDIAERVGVSTALVSYVLSGQEKEKRVGREMAEKIKAVAEELEYTPNRIAQSLRKGSTKTIGLIVADIANPFFGAMARFIEDEANSYGYNLIIGSSDEDSEKSAQLVSTLVNRQVDGFIIVPAEGKTGYLQLIVDEEIPVILIDRYIPDIETNYIVLDNFQATYEATNCLLGRGCKRVGMIAYQLSLVHMKERIRGYREAMSDSGLAKHIVVKEIKYNHVQADMKKALRELLETEDKVDGILFATNALTVNGLYYLRDVGIKIPDDLAIIGFDGNEAFDFFYSPLTYIQQPIKEMSKESVKVLIDQINGSQKIAHITMRPMLIKRQSC